MAQTKIIDRRHPEWRLHHVRWRWLLDSWEGGEAYRQAVYGYDVRGIPVRNLIRHKREYPDPRDASFSLYTGRPAGTDPYVAAADDDYELRLARTPVPTFVAEAVEVHLARIYAREVVREGPKALRDWWSDVDGLGTPIDQWMADTIAPLLLVLGQLDLCFDHPPVPDGETIETRADEIRLRLGSCVASYILPENMLWWQLDRQGRYVECLVGEPQEDGTTFYRHWTSSGSTLYDAKGNLVRQTPHRFGRVPIVRVFDRKRPRCRNIGLPRYESIAELQREFYNRDSELILSDTTQAHPLLQGPEDYVQPDGTVPIGPSWLLPKKKNAQGSSATYEAFEVLEFPKGGADSLRSNKADLRDSVDRAAMLVKPAGAAGSGGSVVSQSGLSKRLDHAAGNDLLSKIAAMLGRAERQAAALAMVVISDGQIDQDPTPLADIRVDYPREFDLDTAEELAAATAKFQQILAAAGHAPRTEGRLLRRLVRLMLPGADDRDYEALDAEISAYLDDPPTAEFGNAPALHPGEGQGHKPAAAIAIDNGHDGQG
jgi:hypothetical protein